MELTLTLKDFLSGYGNSLKKKVLDTLQPSFNPGAKDAWDREMELRLDQLKRKPFPAQANAILSLAKGFYLRKKKGLLLVGEMGVGKTLCAIAVAHLSGKSAYRVLVMCPPHLVQKWIREVKETIPHARTINLNGNGLKQLEELRDAGPPACPEFYVMGRERAKLHYRYRDAFLVLETEDVKRVLCPSCFTEVDPDRVRTKRPLCPECEEPMYQADCTGPRRFAKAEYIKKYLKGVFNLFVADEVHELKGGTTAQGQALADLACAADRTLALTGTLMGGYSTNLFYIFWRLMPRRMVRAKAAFNSPKAFAENYGIVEKTMIESKNPEFGLQSIGKHRHGRTLVKEKPGVSPRILTDFLLEHAVFMRLSDVSKALPPFDEKVVEVSMTPEHQEAYDALKDDLTDAVKRALARGNHSLLGAFVQSLLAYPDGARRGEVVTDPYSEDLIASAPPIDEHILPKEEKLLEILSAEISEGRKCLVCLEHTGTRDLIPDLVERMQERGLRPFALRANTVSTEKREAWVKAKVQSGDYDIMIANPNLIKTGLDLVEFPTIIFFQTGYSVFTLRQASRRSWRIGQDVPVRVYYLSYNDSMQATALSLMAAKLETSLTIEGDLSDGGLAALAQGANSMLIELARSLVEEKEVEPVCEAWKKYKKKEIVTDSFLGDDTPEVETTTTTVTRGDRSTSVTYERVVRGKVYPKKDHAVAYIDSKHKFLLRKGKIFFNGAECGHYDRKGMGEINNKPIQIMKVPQKTYYVLVELKQPDAAAGE